MTVVVIFITFLSVSFFAMIMLSLAQRKFGSENRMSRRLEKFEQKQIKSAANIPFVIREDVLSQIPLLDRILQKLNISQKLGKMISQSDLNIRVGELLLSMMILCGIGHILCHGLSNLLLKIIIPSILGLLPVFFINMKKSKRLKSFVREFPDAIDMMTNALKAGHAFNKALQLVGQEAPDPAGVEFRRTFEEYNLGLPLKEALLNLTERVESSDLKLFITAVLLQKETGGNLTEILEKIGYTIRERFKLMGQMKTYTAQGRMSAWLIGSLPFVFILVISIMSPGYLQPLFEQDVGHTILLASAALQVVGFFVIRKIVTIKIQ